MPLAEMLEDPRRFEFPDHPVVLDGREVPWEICDVAFGLARSKRQDGDAMTRWLACLCSAPARFGYPAGMAKNPKRPRDPNQSEAA